MITAKGRLPAIARGSSLQRLDVRSLSAFVATSAKEAGRGSDRIAYPILRDGPFVFNKPCSDFSEDANGD